MTTLKAPPQPRVEPATRSKDDVPLVSVIVVNWRGLPFIVDCLEAALDQDLPGVEVIVVDNASPDGSVATIRQKFGDRVRVLALDENHGYAGGANAGFAVARGSYFALLNNDAFPERSWLSEMVRVMQEEERVGLVACKTVTADDPSIIDTAGQLVYGDCLSKGRGRLQHDHGQFDRVEEVIFPSGSACLLQRQLIEDIGPMDTRLWMFLEDSDLGLRARLAGWRCLYAPEARVRHLYSATVGAYSPLKAYHVERNHVWVCVKVLPPAMLVAAAWWTLLRLFLQAFGLLTGRGAAARFGERVSAWTIAWTLFRAYRDALFGLPHALRERRRIRKRRRLGNREFRELFRRFRLGARQIAWGD